MRLAYLPLCAAAALAGCSSGSGGQRVAQAPAPPDWRSIATDSDRHRLREWRTAWVRGLEKARASGHGAALAHEGALLQPDAAISWEDPPPGDRKSVVEGTSVSVRVDLGGRGILK